MKKEMLDAQRKRLLEVSVLMESLAETSHHAEILRDAVCELSYVCAELLQDAEDRGPAAVLVPCPQDRGMVLEWLRALPVGTELLDKDRDRWCKKGPEDWRGYDEDADVWDSGSSVSRMLLFYHPFKVIGRAEEPEPRDAEPVPEIKVGDVLTTAAQLETLPKLSVVLNEDEDAWQRCTGGVYYSTAARLGRTTSELAIEGPVTVIWLPKG